MPLTASEGRWGHGRLRSAWGSGCVPGPWASCSASPGPRPSVCPAAPLTFPLVWEKQRERVAWVTERRGPAGPAGAGPGCPSRSGEDGGGAVLPARGGSRGGLGAQRLLGVTHRAERGADGTGGASPRRAAAPGLAGAQQCRLQTSFFLLQERYTLAVQTPQVGAPSLVPPPRARRSQRPSLPGFLGVTCLCACVHGARRKRTRGHKSVPNPPQACVGRG